MRKAVPARATRHQSPRDPADISRKPHTHAMPPTFVQRRHSTALLLLRWLPFVAVALYSLVMAADAPHGRKPFTIDWSLSRAALEYSLVKAPHIGATAVLGLLGVIAVGRERWTLAFFLTVLVAWGWELCQTTVAGRSARLSDLAPDGVGTLIGCMLGVAALWTVDTLGRQDDTIRP